MVRSRPVEFGEQAPHSTVTRRLLCCHLEYLHPHHDMLSANVIGPACRRRHSMSQHDEPDDRETRSQVSTPEEQLEF